MSALLTKLPKIWNLEDHVVGTDLGLGKFQFDFQKEEDIEGVLKLQPYHFDYWMLALAKWQPRRSSTFPSEIPFWVRVLGVTKEFRTVATFESIGDAIGKTVKVDLDQMRVLVILDAFQELCFETSIEFKGGEFYEGEEVAIYISLRYEKLFGYCDDCGSLCHEAVKCPLAKGKGLASDQGNIVVSQGNGGWVEGGKHDDRARSYKGVVTNGVGGHQNRERDGREHYGKGKGKYTEETDSKWTKVGEKSNKKTSSGREYHGGEGGSSRNHSSHRQETRPNRQGGNTGVPSGGMVTQRDQPRPPLESREEGEIIDTREKRTLSPSKDFQDQLAKTQADGAEVVSNPVDEEMGLLQVQSLVEDKIPPREEEEMEWDAIKAACREDGLDVDAADDLPDLTEEEERAFQKMMEDTAVIHESGEGAENATGT